VRTPITTRASNAALPGTKKSFDCRISAFRSQRLRLASQLAFLALNVWLGIQFYLWVRQFETNGVAMVERPAGVEGWLPVASLMNLKYLVLTFTVPDIHPAGMFLLIAFIAMSLFFRKAFCSWVCPIATLSEYLWKFGRYCFKRNVKLPFWGDIALRSPKYILLGFFLYVIGGMETLTIENFLASPYGIIADVKMLNFFRFMSITTAVVIGILLVLSIFVQNFWCRYLCPYGALMGLFSLFSPTRIERNREQCIDCGKCAKACPSYLPVDRLVQIRSAECTGCLECVAVCPNEGALYAAIGIPLSSDPTRKLSPLSILAGVAILFFGIVGFAKVTNHWRSDIPRSIYQDLVPKANGATHPIRK
jgi:polyferredoxin